MSLASSVSDVSDCGSRSQCVVLVPAFSHIEPVCETALRELESRGYVVRRAFGYAAIDYGRSVMATAALNDGFEQLMWIDADMSFNPDFVDQLRRHSSFMERRGIEPSSQRLIREQADCHQALSQSDATRQIDRQHANRCAADCGTSHQNRPIPTKVSSPNMVSGMKERLDLIRARIEPGEVRPLVQVAEIASESEVVRVIATVVFPGNDVLDVKAQSWHDVLRKPAVLAAVLSACPNHSAETCFHGRASLARTTRASVCSSVSISRAKTDDSYSARSSGVSSPSVHLSAKTSSRACVFLSSFTRSRRCAALSVRHSLIGSSARFKTVGSVEVVMGDIVPLRQRDLKPILTKGTRSSEI